MMEVNSTKLAIASGIIGTSIIAGREALKGLSLREVDPTLPSGGDLAGMVLKKHGVKHIFALSGGHIAPVYVGAARQGIEVIDVRHEVNAAFAADAYARLTGIPGIATVTAGPGVTNTITAIQNAKMAESPVIVLGGATSTLLMGRGSLQDIDHIALMRSITKWSASPRTVGQLVCALEQAFVECRRGVPGPVFLELPMDLTWPAKEVFSGIPPLPNTLTGRAMKFVLYRHINTAFGDTPREIKSSDSTRALVDYSVSQSDLTRSASILSNAKRPLIIIGSQAMLRQDDVAELATALQRIGVPLYANGMARGILGKNSTIQFKHHRKEAIAECDAVILCGVVCDFRLSYGRVFSKCGNVISVNRSRSNAKMNISPNLVVETDPATFLLEFAKNFSGEGKWADWCAKLQKRELAREAAIASNASSTPRQALERVQRVLDQLVTTTPAQQRTLNPSSLASTQSVFGLNPVHLCMQINKLLDDNSIIVVDGGDFVGTAAYTIHPRQPLSWLDPGAFGTLGVGAGFALAAKTARPDAEVWIMYGDGAVGFSIAEFDTFARRKMGLIAIVGNDGCWTQIARDQTRLLQNESACNLAYTNYHKVVEGFGGKSFLITSATEIEDVLTEAKQIAKKGVPVLVNCVIAKNDFREGAISV